MNIFKNKKILITGATGSIGSALVKFILKKNCKVVRALSNDENGLYELSTFFNSFDKKKKFEKVMEEQGIRYLHGDICDFQRCLIATENIDIVIHAAAIKHVPFCEFNPFEANKINVIGTQNMVIASMQNKVKKFILISTEKVVNPSSCLGATKLLAEKITINANMIRGASKTQFSCVRFGNVLGSRGSIIPTFLNQIKRNKKLTLTDKDMIRYFMTIDDAVHVIASALEKMIGGEVFVPRKLKKFKIYDLAKVLIDQYNLDEKKFLKITGKRPSEKLEENLLFDHELENIKLSDQFYIIDKAKNNNFKQIDNLKKIVNNYELIEKKEIRNFLEKIYNE